MFAPRHAAHTHDGGSEANIGQVKERLHRCGWCAVRAFKIGAHLGELRRILRHGNAAVRLHPAQVTRYIAARNAGGDTNVQHGVAGHHTIFRTQFAHCLLKELAIHLVSDRGDVPALLRAQEIARAANF